MIIPTDIAAKIVGMYDSGVHFGKVAESLNSQGIPCPTVKGRWSRSTIQRIYYQTSGKSPKRTRGGNVKRREPLSEPQQRATREIAFIYGKNGVRGVIRLAVEKSGQGVVEMDVPSWTRFVAEFLADDGRIEPQHISNLSESTVASALRTMAELHAGKNPRRTVDYPVEITPNGRYKYVNDNGQDDPIKRLEQTIAEMQSKIDRLEASSSI